MIETNRLDKWYHINWPMFIANYWVTGGFPSGRLWHSHLHFHIIHENALVHSYNFFDIIGSQFKMIQYRIIIIIQFESRRSLIYYRNMCRVSSSSPPTTGLIANVTHIYWLYFVSIPNTDLIDKLIIVYGVFE